MLVSIAGLPPIGGGGAPEHGWARGVPVLLQVMFSGAGNERTDHLARSVHATA